MRTILRSFGASNGAAIPKFYTAKNVLRSSNGAKEDGVFVYNLSSSLFLFEIMDQQISKITNLCYIVNDKNQLLLIMKKRGFGEGKWNAPGGKVKENEDRITAVCREVEEEVGLMPIEPREQGFIEFIWEDKLEWNQRCFLYYTENFQGSLQESEEALPQWFEKDKIPFDQMWGDDIYWLKEFLGGKVTRMRFFFDKNNKIEKFENIIEGA